MQVLKWIRHFFPGTFHLFFYFFIPLPCMQVGFLFSHASTSSHTLLSLRSQMALKFHPDKNKVPGAEDAFKSKYIFSLLLLQISPS